MRLNNAPKIIQWWMTPKLPEEHIWVSPESKPEGLPKIFRIYFRKWLTHPVKRRIAKYYLKFLQEFFNITVVGITGSTGKTTTKEMVASILKQKGETVWSYANIDPVYNIPTTILKCKPNTRYLVLEMGVEFIGEMDYYLWLAQPDIAVITNIYPTHIEFFKSTRGVAKEKGELAKSISRPGFAILNQENGHLRKIAQKIKPKITWFGKGGFVRAKNIEVTNSLSTKYTLAIGESKINIQLPLLGKQFVQNSLAAAAVGHVCGVSLGLIKRGLENFELSEHRMEIIRLPNGGLILDDSYNNNPAAAKEALNVLKEITMKKTKIAVLGDMLELGKHERKYHREIGRLVSTLGIDYLIGVGPVSKFLVEEARKKMKKDCIFWAEKESDVLPVLKPLLKKDTAILIKGSRSIGLDKVVSRLS